MSRSTALLVGGLGLLGTALTVQGIRKFASFDNAMTESLAIMGDVSGAMEEDMATAAREMARETIFSADQAAESYFFLASAGLDAEQSIAAMPQVAQFAQAGMFDMARATELLTDAQSALGLSTEDINENMENMARVSDVLVKANTLANATVEQFSESLTNRAAPRLRQLNKEIEEGVAALAVFADQGIKGRRAGTLLDMTLRELSRRARENEDAFKEMNVEVFREGEMRNVADIFEDLENAFEGMTTKARAAALAQLGFQQRSMRGILALMGQSDALREYQREMEKAGGITEEVADKQLDTIIKQLGLLGSELVDVSIEMGEPFGPAIQKQIEDTIEWIRKLRDGIKAVRFEVERMPDVDEAIQIGPRGADMDPDRAAELDQFSDVTETRENINDLISGIRGLPSIGQQLMRNLPATRENLRAVQKVLGSLPPRVRLAVNNLAEAEAVLRRMEAGAESWGQAMMEANVPLRGIPELVKPSIRELEKMDADSLKTELEEIEGNASSLVDLTEARHEAGLPVVGQLAQIESLRSRINDMLEADILLQDEQQASLLGILNTTNDLLDEIADSPIAKKVERVSENAENLVTKFSVFRDLNRDTAGLSQEALTVYGNIDSVINSLEKSDMRRLDLLQDQARILELQRDLGREMLEDADMLPDPTLALPRSDLSRARQRDMERRGPIQPHGQRALRGMNEEIEGGMESDEAQEAMQRAADKSGSTFINAMEGRKKQLARLGADLIVSMAEGADSATDMLKSTVLSVIRMGIQAVIMSYFGIASPSRMMIGFGENITIGLAEGIAGEADRVNKAWMGVLDQVNRPQIALGGDSGNIITSGQRQIPGESQRMRLPEPSFRMELDLSGMEERKTPFDIVRDHEWQRVLRDSIKISRQDGFDDGNLDRRRAHNLP